MTQSQKENTMWNFIPFPHFTKTRLIDRPVSPRVMQKPKPSINDKLHTALRQSGPQHPLKTPKQYGYVPKSRDLVNDLRKAGL